MKARRYGMWYNLSPSAVSRHDTGIRGAPLHASWRLGAAAWLAGGGRRRRPALCHWTGNFGWVLAHCYMRGITHPARGVSDRYRCALT